MCNRRDISIAPTTLSIRLYTQTTKEHQDSTDRRTDGRTDDAFPNDASRPRAARRRTTGSGKSDVVSVFGGILLTHRHRTRKNVFLFFFSFSSFSNSMCGIEFSPRVVALLEEDVFEREKFPPFLRSKVSLSRFCVSDATLTFFSLLRLRNNRAVCSSNSSSSSIDRVLGLDLTGGDDIIAKVSGAVDGAKRVRAHPRVLQRRHWYRSRHDQLVRCGHGRQKRESYRKRGRVKDDAVHGGI